MNKNVKRGHVWYADLGDYDDTTFTSEQRGIRPVIIISNNMGNKYSPTAICGILSSKINKMRLPTHVKIKDLHKAGLEEESFAGLEQIRTIDKSKLREYLGWVSEDDMIEIDKAIDISLGTNRINRVRTAVAELEQMDKLIKMAEETIPESDDKKLLSRRYRYERNNKVNFIYGLCERYGLSIDKFMVV